VAGLARVARRQGEGEGTVAGGNGPLDSVAGVGLLCSVRSRSP
jgi:hypothetical protein